MLPGAILSFEPITGRTLRFVALLSSLAMAALIYLLVAIPSPPRLDCPSDCHHAQAAAHLPRGTGDLHSAHHILAARSALAAAKATPSGASGPRGPALIAVLTALVAALLGFFPGGAMRAFQATVEAVLGVGRWHRTVVLNL